MMSAGCRFVVRGVTVASALAFASAVSAATLGSSDFDASAEGWQAINGATGIEWVSTGGSDGGYVRASDQASGALWFFAAPTTFIGNQSAAYGGELSFAVRSESPSAPLANTYAQVQLLGSNGVLLAWHGAPDPGSSWTNYAVTLDSASGWTLGSVGGPAATEADLRAVLGNLQAMRIRGDYGQAVDTTGLDSVSLVSAVPEPVSSLLMLVGLAGVAGRARRQTRTCRS
jgi:hypothetical protein